MANYQAIPFGKEWNEDPNIFLSWFLECMGVADDKTKARQFVYYLQADSDADEWFEDLLEEEKSSWVIIERLFRKRWLKEEEIRTKESVTSENEPQPTSIHPTTAFSTSQLASGTHTNPLDTISSTTTDHFAQTNPTNIQTSCQIMNSPPPSQTSASATFSSSPVTLGKEIGITTTHDFEIGHLTRAATTQSMEPYGNGENAKIDITSENSLYNTVFSLEAPSITFSDATIPPTITTPLKTRSKLAIFTQKVEKLAVSIHPNTHITPLPSSTPVFTLMKLAGHLELENASSVFVATSQAQMFIKKGIGTRITPTDIVSFQISVSVTSSHSSASVFTQIEHTGGPELENASSAFTAIPQAQIFVRKGIGTRSQPLSPVFNHFRVLLLGIATFDP